MSTIYDDPAPTKVLLIGRETLPLAADLSTCELSTATSLATALRAARKYKPAVAIMPLALTDFAGMEALLQFKRFEPDVSIVVYARDASEAVDAKLHGADDSFVGVPIDLPKRIETVANQVVQPHSFRSICSDVRRMLSEKKQHDSDVCDSLKSTMAGT